MDSVSRLAAAAASRIEDGALFDGTVETLASELGVSSRHLRRVVEREFGVSPSDLAQTRRLLLAKRLLTDTILSVTDVAYSSGFSSLRRFNTAFKEGYRMNPTAVRRGNDARVAGQTLLCELAYCSPFDWESLLAFLAPRASSGVEMMEGGRYLRTVAIGSQRGWIAVWPSLEKSVLKVEISASLAPALVPVLAGVKRLFDLSAEPGQIALCLGPLAAAHPGLRVAGAFDGFEMAVRAILGQQVSVKAATTLACRFANTFGEKIETPFPELMALPPTAERIARAEASELTALGIVGARVNAILALARAVAEGRIALKSGVDAEQTMARLCELPGIGEWTAQYIGMRALAWPDAFPHTDLALRKALGENNPKRILEIAHQWRPWRSYAAMHLWKSLETQP